MPPLMKLHAAYAAESRGGTFMAAKEEETMGTILIILLILLLIGAIPSWPHSRNWGYFPSGLLGLVLIVVILLAIIGRL